MELRHLSNKELSVALEALVKHERATSVQVLEHLVEVERRELFLQDGYGSLFSYCRKKLLYSEPAANRRICSARALAKFPELRCLLMEGELSLTTLSLVSRQLNAENKDQVLASIRGKSRSEVEEILAETRPQSRTVERVRPIVVAPRAPAASSKEASTSEQTTAPQTLGLFNALRPSPEKVKAAAIVPSAPTPVPEKRYALSFSVDEKTFAELEEVKALLSSSLPQGVSLEEALKVLLGQYLERHSPAKRQARRLAAADKQKTSVEAPSPKVNPEITAETKVAPANRHIPAKIRDEVLCRDGGRCSYISPEGVRCGCRHNLQLDHIVPFAAGGRHSAENLRVVCDRHNRHLAKLYFGEEHMLKYLRA